MRVIQVLPTLSFGDAIGNDTVALKRVLQKAGYDTQIYAENIDLRLPYHTAKPIERIGRLTDKDVMLYHLSTGTALNDGISRFPCRKIIIYHNITPEAYFRDVSTEAEMNCRNGRRQAARLKGVADFAFADSEYNADELREMGYGCPIEVLPILIPFADYGKKPDKGTSKMLADGKTNILFTGRVAPNKKQEKLIEAFYYYRKYYNPGARLCLVGNYTGTERYYERLVSYAKKLGLEKDVVFTGMLSFAKILAYYRAADVFLCMSAHEGFCVPLVEAMYFNIPIVARDTSAVGETLGGGGFLLKDADPLVAAGVLDRVLKDRSLKETMLYNQRLRLQDFDDKKVAGLFLRKLKEFIKTEKLL